MSPGYTGAFAGAGFWPGIARVSRATSLTRLLHGRVAMPTRTQPETNPLR